jgi:hypothetical protein
MILFNVNGKATHPLFISWVSVFLATWIIRGEGKGECSSSSFLKLGYGAMKRQCAKDLKAIRVLMINNHLCMYNN